MTKTMDAYEWMTRDLSDPDVMEAELQWGELTIVPHLSPAHRRSLENLLVGEFEVACRKPRVDQERLQAINAARHSHLYRSRLRGHVADLTLWQWSEILAAYEYQCAYCGEREFEEFEHIMPVSQGGGTTAMNVAPTCLVCNRRKYAKTPAAWFEELGISEQAFLARHERIVRRIWSLQS